MALALQGMQWQYSEARAARRIHELEVKLAESTAAGSATMLHVEELVARCEKADEEALHHRRANSCHSPRAFAVRWPQ